MLSAREPKIGSFAREDDVLRAPPIWSKDPNRLPESEGSNLARENKRQISGKIWEQEAVPGACGVFVSDADGNWEVADDPGAL
jgi:hypothetical protein